MNCVHVGKAIKKDTKSGAFPCDYCEETFQSSRGRSQHARNQHAAAQSAHLAGESSLKTSVDPQPWHWDEETVEKFIRALFVVGTSSNVEIATEMRSKKTAYNVKGYKLKFLKDHPKWNTELRYLNPKGVSSDSEIATQEEEIPEVTTEVVAVETPAEREETVVIEAAVEIEGVPEKEVVTHQFIVNRRQPWKPWRQKLSQGKRLPWKWKPLQMKRGLRKRRSPWKWETMRK